MTKIDIVIPVHKKDLPKLPLVIEYIKKNLYISNDFNIKQNGYKFSHYLDEVQDLETKTIDKAYIKKLYKEYKNLITFQKDNVRKFKTEDMVIIADKNLKNEIMKIDKKLRFLDEDTIYDSITTKEEDLLTKEKINNIISNGNWYFQQFLKISYSYICKKEAYLVWDCDSFLIREMLLDKPFLNVLPSKTSPKNYIKTYKNITGIDNFEYLSFVGEFMLFITDITQDFIKSFNTKEAHNYWKLILEKAIELDASFSEFECYASYALRKTNYYDIRSIPVFRIGGRFQTLESLDKDVLQYISKYFYTFQINHFDKKSIFTPIMNNKFFLKIIGFRNLLRIYHKIGLYKKEFN